MRFYKNLWVSENAAGKKFQIIWKLKHFRPQSDVYVLVLADTPHDLIHIRQKSFSSHIIRKDTGIFL